jgi:hypothetical protein
MFFKNRKWRVVKNHLRYERRVAHELNNRYWRIQLQTTCGGNSDIEKRSIQHLRYKSNEPRHDKTNIMDLRPAWIQTSLRIRAV